MESRGTACILSDTCTLRTRQLGGYLMCTCMLNVSQAHCSTAIRSSAQEAKLVRALGLEPMRTRPCPCWPRAQG